MSREKKSHSRRKGRSESVTVDYVHDLIQMCGKPWTWRIHQKTVRTDGLYRIWIQHAKSVVFTIIKIIWERNQENNPIYKAKRVLRNNLKNFFYLTEQHIEGETEVFEALVHFSNSHNSRYLAVWNQQSELPPHFPHRLQGSKYLDCLLTSSQTHYQKVGLATRSWVLNQHSNLGWRHCI